VRRRRIALSGVTVEVDTEHDDLARYLAAQLTRRRRGTRHA